MPVTSGGRSLWLLGCQPLCPGLVDPHGTAVPQRAATQSSRDRRQYVSSAAMKSTVAWTAEIVKRGKRLVVVECTARDRKGRLVARGCVTKTLRGAAKL